MTFGQTIEALKEGKRAKLMHWESGYFIFMQVPSMIKKEIVPNMQSLPQSVKDEFERRFNDPKEHFDCIKYQDQIAIVDPICVIEGWNPTAFDLFTDTWEILD